MPNNRRSRMEEIAAAAAAIVEQAGGAEKIASLPEKKRLPKITELRKRLEADTNCFRTVSLRHIKAAVGLTEPVGKGRWQKGAWPAAKVYVRATAEELQSINRRIPNPRKRAEILLEYEEEQE